MVGRETDHVAALAAPIVERVGLDLVDVEVKGGGKQRLLRVVVDRAGGVDLASCERVSAELSRALDAADEDPLSGSYNLEVTSPGTHRPLRDREAFARVVGRPVLVHHAADGDRARPRQLAGHLLAAEEDAIVVRRAPGDDDDAVVRVPYDEVVKATQRLPW